MELPVDQITAVAQRGSPTALHAFGRLFGIGEAERRALFGGSGIPGWALLGVGVLAGVAAGAMIHRRWPAQTEKLLGG